MRLMTRRKRGTIKNSTTIYATRVISFPLKSLATYFLLLLFKQGRGATLSVIIGMRLFNDSAIYFHHLQACSNGQLDQILERKTIDELHQSSLPNAAEVEERLKAYLKTFHQPTEDVQGTVGTFETLVSNNSTFVKKAKVLRLIQMLNPETDSTQLSTLLTTRREQLKQNLEYQGQGDYMSFVKQIAVLYRSLAEPSKKE